MGSPAPQHPMTSDEFLAFENASPIKHEYVRGEVFAMTGTSDFHNDVVHNVSSLLRDHLRGKPCRAHHENIKLRVEAANAYFYPDVFVTCDPRDRDDHLVKRHPVLIVEVLSESTAEYDRTDKFDDYQLLESLREYALVDSRQRRAIVYRKGDDGRWDRAPMSDAASVTLASIGLTTSIAALYDDTDVPEFRSARERGAVEG
ncbi:MAG: Uma2 family endonuclease [Polyangiales bacterium]